MVLSPAASWGLLLVVFGSVVLGIWIATRPTRTSARRSKRLADDLDELQRLERARQAIERVQNRSNVRIGRPTPPPAKDTHEQ